MVYAQHVCSRNFLQTAALLNLYKYVSALPSLMVQFQAPPFYAFADILLQYADFLVLQSITLISRLLILLNADSADK